MKKGSIIAAFVLMLAGGLWVVQQRWTQAPSIPRAPLVSGPGVPRVAAKPAVIDYVPADTVLFFGTLEPVAMPDYRAMMQTHLLGISDAKRVRTDLERQLGSMSGAGHEPPQGVRMLFGLYAESLVELGKPDGMTEIGMAVPFDSGIYMQGPLPVLRMRLRDEVAFDAFVGRAAARFGAKGETAAVDGLSYQRFALTAPGTVKPPALVVAHHDGFAVLTLDLGDLVAPQTLAQALGKTRPARSLAASGKLERIAQANGFLPLSVGLLDHAGLVRAITHADDPLAVFLDKLSDGATGRALASYRAPACRRELQALAGLWPRTVFGYTRLDTESSPMVMDTLVKIESTDASLMKTLMGLRGFVPAYGGGGVSRVEVKLGINMDELAPTLSALWSRAAKANFTCTPLMAAQDQLRRLNPALLGLITGVVRGLEGLGLAIQDIRLKPGAGGDREIERFDGLVSVSTKHPEQLWALLATFGPGFAAVSLPEDGQAVDLPLPWGAQLPRRVRLGHYGSHLALFSGDRAAAVARSLAGQPLVENGLYEAHLDYGLFADLLALIPDPALAAAVQAADAKAAGTGAKGEAAPRGSAAPANEGASVAGAAASAPALPTPADLAEMRKSFERLRGMSVDMKLDFVPDGITLGGRLEIRKGA